MGILSSDTGQQKSDLNRLETEIQNIRNNLNVIEGQIKELEEKEEAMMEDLPTEKALPEEVREEQIFFEEELEPELEQVLSKDNKLEQQLNSIDSQERKDVMRQLRQEGFDIDRQKLEEAKEAVEAIGNLIDEFAEESARIENAFENSENADERTELVVKHREKRQDTLGKVLERLESVKKIFTPGS